MMRMLYAGSFDPVTNGHMNIIERTARLCDELVVAVMHNPDKRGAFGVEQRVSLLQKACAQIPNVRVIAHSGLLVDCAREMGVNCVVRGVRPLGEFESEYQMAPVNRMLGGVETLMMPTTERLASVSSSIVRQIAGFGGSIDNLVPACIAEEIREALAKP